ncbi:MAG TPA: SRPBCC domain-containing protein [Ignavibacteriaceae bacterium]|nr:SRPBCC domain-containing protein [Ignavibacteriaceae bacterium]
MKVKTGKNKIEKPIEKEVVLKAPVSKVWKALTEKNQMKKWYFDIAEFEAEADFKFQFYGEGLKGEKYLHLCKIIEVIPEKKLSYSWKYENYPGNSLVTFELFSEGNNTRLKLTHEGIESFGTDNPDFAKKSFEMGWSEIIGKSIKDFVES